jgi:flagellar basal-body rod protein FlgB
MAPLLLHGLAELNAMIDALFNQAGYLGAKRMLDAAVARHEAIAANIANAETPRYQRVDLAPSFTKELQSAIATKDLNRLRAAQPRVAVDARALPNKRDGNTVNLEQEVVRMSENGLQHAVESQVASAYLAKLRLAITGKSA